MGMAVRVFGLKEKKERNRQIIIRIRGESNTEKGLAGKKWEGKQMGKEKERRKKRGRK